MGVLVGRDREREQMLAVLEQARLGPAALVIDGPAGIGKTTLCRAARDIAADKGFRVLATTGAAAEMSLAWAGLADLLADMDEESISGLSSLHQQALRAVTSGLEAPGGDERLVASAFRAALEQLCRQGPLLIVADDAQWLDEPSKLALGFAVRRLSGPVGVIAAYRSGEPGGLDKSWVQPTDRQSVNRLTLGPMNDDELDAVIDARLGHTPPEPTLKKIHVLSGGNPFYAVELARAIEQSPDGELDALPMTLAELVYDQIGGLDEATSEVLVTVAAAFEPTVEVVAMAVGRDPSELIAILEPLESRSALSFDGNRIRFSHPLMASGITEHAEPAVLRAVHRRLADVSTNPESRARHLALSTPHGDEETLAALDAAAEIAAARGTYSAAAGLLTSAIRLGGDTPIRRLRATEFLFRAGGLDEGEALISSVIDDLPEGLLRAAGLMLIAGIQGYRDGVASAAAVLEKAAAEAGEIPMIRTQALLFRSLAAGAADDLAASVEYARLARIDADASGMPELRSRALALWTYVNMNYGQGLDEEALAAAMELGDFDDTEPVTLQPSAVRGVVCAWSGELDQARTAMTEVMRRCAERGLEIDMLWVAKYLTMIDLALGRHDDAEKTASEALRRAQQIGGQIPLISAYTAIADVAAHRGKLDETSVAVELAVEGAKAAGLDYMVRWPLMRLGFVQLSTGQYAEALETLKPLLASFDPEHDTEIETGAFLPDATAALAALGRGREAEPLVAALEANGIRHDRPWMLAVGARSRAILKAVNGDLDGAIESAEEAMKHHDRLPMPLERARTQLLLGQLQRRRRRIQAAHDNLSEAARVFTQIGSPLWAARAEDELERLTTRSVGAELTDSERRVAELASSGLTNKQIAADLYLSVKTVEMYLSNAYRKLGIRSRTQLVDRLRGADPS